ncbi:LOG family protein [Rhodobium gokarnense]|uniref:Cytokinin riboside 5'-monophosphate phosphoribohydrolase n=1 Tax=Rhodobium gokarnense TaxID=364296 RepID=A0ABT3H826_9HYPH|nr:TIGR00730 family Rossman fold protein [Rhodobium gokarnense]MCW2306543.1 uncharacterized protein (TIGR00730 family) [Rhodobium gokarnense]
MQDGEGRRSGKGFPTAVQDREAWERTPDTPQTLSPAYRLAFDDPDFLLRPELRPMRLQLELLKPEIILRERGIDSTIVIFGSARIAAPGGEPIVDATPEIAERLAAKQHYYDEARKLARLASQESMKHYGREFVVCSGGGPGIMEAANRGAAEIGAPSIGLNIVLPHEQAPNEYISPALSFQFHYFAVRKMHFLLRAKALACFPGGFGTFDELFEALCLIQTGKVEPMPILLFGEDYWRRVINFEALVEEGTIAPRDLHLFSYVETAEDGWKMIRDYYDI